MDKFAARKSSCVIRVVDAEGHPVKGASVHAELKDHEFLFGTGVFFTTPLADPNTDPVKKQYLQKIYEEWKKTFNYGTASFYIGRYEPEKGKTLEKETLRATAMLHADGKNIKGHPLCWHTVSAPWMYDYTEEEVMNTFLSRIEREIGAFKQDIRFWDVINEVVIMPEFVNEPANMPRMNPMTRVCRKLGRVQTIKTLFDKAHECDPDATFLLNDFNTSTRYSDLVRDCLDAGVGISAIGIQSHQHQGFWGMEKLMEVTERFEKFGLPIHYTENTFVSGHLMPPEIVDLNDYVVDEWPSTPEGEEYQKDMMMTMLEYLFSRPQVEGFTTWDFEDHQWLKAPSGLIHSDGTPKKSLLALQERLRGEWHTDAQLVTDDNGCCELNGYRGKYTVTVNGKEQQIVLKKDSPECVVVM